MKLRTMKKQSRRYMADLRRDLRRERGHHLRWLILAITRQLAMSRFVGADAPFVRMIEGRYAEGGRHG